MKKRRLANAPKLDELIREVRRQKIMLDFDLAQVYGVETKSLNRAVKRNADRFPKDFMFQVTRREFEALRYQIGTLKTGRGQHRKYLPYVFTEHGAIMAANVLNSARAVQMMWYRVSQNARVARRQARVGSKTCLVGKGAKKATRCS